MGKDDMLAKMRAKQGLGPVPTLPNPKPVPKAPTPQPAKKHDEAKPKTPKADKPQQPKKAPNPNKPFIPHSAMSLDGALKRKPRLPYGSFFRSPTWTALPPEQVTDPEKPGIWTTTLVIPGCPVEFTDTYHALFKCMVKCDNQYRKYVGQEQLPTLESVKEAKEKAKAEKAASDAAPTPAG